MLLRRVMIGCYSMSKFRLTIPGAFLLCVIIIAILAEGDPEALKLMFSLAAPQYW